MSSAQGRRPCLAIARDCYEKLVGETSEGRSASLLVAECFSLLGEKPSSTGLVKNALELAQLVGGVSTAFTSSKRNKTNVSHLTQSQHNEGGSTTKGNENRGDLTETESKNSDCEKQSTIKCSVGTSKEVKTASPVQPTDGAHDMCLKCDETFKNEHKYSSHMNNAHQNIDVEEFPREYWEGAEKKKAIAGTATKRKSQKGIYRGASKRRRYTAEYKNECIKAYTKGKFNGTSQKECADQFGIDQSMLSKWLNDHKKKNSALIKSESAGASKKRVNSVINFFVCQECRKTFRATKDFLSHMNETHPNVNSQENLLVSSLIANVGQIPLAGCFECKDCRKTFMSRAAYMAHTKHNHVDIDATENVICKQIILDDCTKNTSIEDEEARAQSTEGSIIVGKDETGDGHREKIESALVTPKKEMFKRKPGGMPRRMQHTAEFKLSVLQEWEERKWNGKNMTQKVVAREHGISQTLLSKWLQEPQRSRILEAGFDKKRRKFKRTGPVRNSGIFPEAEKLLNDQFCILRDRGEQVTEKWFSLTAQAIVHETYETDAGHAGQAARMFKASKCWRKNFCKRWKIPKPKDGVWG